MKNTVIQVVSKVREALGDLLVPASLVRRTYSPHVPGQAPVSSASSVSVSVYLSRFKGREIDADRVLATDYKAIVLPANGEVLSIEVNDLITISSMGLTLRTITADRITAGDKVVMATAQLRI